MLKRKTSKQSKLSKRLVDGINIEGADCVHRATQAKRCRLTRRKAGTALQTTKANGLGGEPADIYLQQSRKAGLQKSVAQHSHVYRRHESRWGVRDSWRTRKLSPVKTERRYQPRAALCALPRRNADFAIQRPGARTRTRGIRHAVFGTKSEVLGQVIVNATSIKKNCPGLITCARDKSSEVAGRFKYQRATARQNLRFESNDFVRSSDDECSGCLVHVGRNIECTTRNEVLLRVPVVPVTRIRRQPTAEMVAIAYEKTTGVCRMLIDTASARVLGEEARTLNGNLLPRLILGGG